jgi:putative membrane protein
MMHWGNYGWGMGFGWIWMIFFWGLIIAGIAYLVQAITRRSGKGRAEETALDILKKRFVRGDISKEQYEQMKNGLA